MKRPMTLIVRDPQGDEWSFRFYGDPAYLADWRAAGLTVYEAVATVPYWAASSRLLTWAIVRAQALWQWLRMF